MTRQLEMTEQLKVTNMSFTMVIVLSLILRAEMVYINGTTLNLIKEVDSGLLDGFDCGIPKDISIHSLEGIAKCSEQVADVQKSSRTADFQVLQRSDKFTIKGMFCEGFKSRKHTFCGTFSHGL